MKIDYILDHTKKTHSGHSKMTFMCRHCDAVQDELVVAYYYSTALVKEAKKRRWRYLDQYVAQINNGKYDMFRNQHVVERLKGALCNCDGKAAAFASLRKSAQERKSWG